MNQANDIILTHIQEGLAAAIARAEFEECDPQVVALIKKKAQQIAEDLQNDQ